MKAVKVQSCFFSIKRNLLSRIVTLNTVLLARLIYRINSQDQQPSRTTSLWILNRTNKILPLLQFCHLSKNRYLLKIKMLAIVVRRLIIIQVWIILILSLKPVLLLLSTNLEQALALGTNHKIQVHQTEETKIRADPSLPQDIKKSKSLLITVTPTFLIQKVKTNSQHIEDS